MSIKNKPPGTLSSVILWSVISAAFIGPGTITTAVSVGSLFQLDLLWAVVFATVACIVLQEIAARITIASGLNLGQTFTMKFGIKGQWLKFIIGGSVMLGCAAYEAGNILGAVAGLNLVTGFNQSLLTGCISGVVLLVLWVGRPLWISYLMMLLVAIMGISFFMLAWTSTYSLPDIFLSAFRPAIPHQAEMLTLGLIGTTVVPYALFIGSGISKGQTIPLMRIGLTISVLLGGLITASILIAGTTVTDFSSFELLATTFETILGKPGYYALALGLFAAGFSSAITAPYASGIIARIVFSVDSEKKARWFWGGVLLTGFIFGVSGVKPIPVILLVQALNGLILPLLTIFLILIINDHTIIPERGRHKPWYNVVLLAILFVMVLIGLNQIDRVMRSSFDLQSHLILSVCLSLIVVGWVGYIIYRSDPSHKTNASVCNDDNL
jgi:manganese transport protein